MSPERLVAAALVIFASAIEPAAVFVTLVAATGAKSATATFPAPEFVRLPLVV